LSEWQIMPELTRCCFLLCSEYITTNREEIFVISDKFFCSTRSHMTRYYVQKLRKHKALTDIRRRWHVCCYKILSD
jgi:hypothetical protein